MKTTYCVLFDVCAIRFQTGASIDVLRDVCKLFSYFYETCKCDHCHSNELKGERRPHAGGQE